MSAGRGVGMSIVRESIEGRKEPFGGFRGPAGHDLYYPYSASIAVANRSNGPRRRQLCSYTCQVDQADR